MPGGGPAITNTTFAARQSWLSCLGLVNTLMIQDVLIEPEWADVLGGGRAERHSQAGALISAAKPNACPTGSPPR